MQQFHPYALIFFKAGPISPLRRHQHARNRDREEQRADERDVLVFANVRFLLVEIADVADPEPLEGEEEPPRLGRPPRVWDLVPKLVEVLARQV